MFPNDHSEWAKNFLQGKRPIIEIAGSVKLLPNAGPIIIDLDEEVNLVEEVDSLEEFWSRKGKNSLMNRNSTKMFVQGRF